MGVNTIKFSQFSSGSLSNATNFRVGVTGLSGGTDYVLPDVNSWTTATRPSAPPSGTLGINTSLNEMEFWNGVSWQQLTSSSGGSVNPGTINQLAYYAATGNVLSGLTTANNGVLVTSNTGVPSISSTLPSGISATNMVLITPNIGTPSAGTLTNCIGLPIAGISGLGTGVATALAAAVTGSGGIVLSNGAILVAPALGTPASGILTNCTGLSLTTGITGTLLIAHGGTSVTSVTTSPTASSWAGWDANSNMSANSFLSGYTTTATAAGTTTLTVGSTYLQFFTGSTTQTVVMPVVSTLVLGQQYALVNNSSGNITVNSSGGNNILTMTTNTVAYLTCVAITGTTATSWYYEFVNKVESTGTVTSVSTGTGLTGGPITTSGTISLQTPFVASTQVAQAFVNATLSSDAMGVTGDGTTYTIAFNSVTVDRSSNYNNSTYVFTAPATGYYEFIIHYNPYGYSSDNTVTQINLVATGGTYALVAKTVNTNAASVGAAGAIEETQSIMIPMNSGDTAHWTLRVSGHATKNINFASGIDGFFTVRTVN